MTGANWDNYNLPAIWAMLEPDNVCTGADKVLAWDSLATAVRDQHKRLQAAGQKLADAWPPEKNDSAKTFLTQIDILLDSMQETMNAAASTHAGLRGVMAAISQAQADVRELGAGRESVSTDLMPRFIDHAEDEYDAKAQQAMRDMEAAIADHTKQITAPALYQMHPKIDGKPGITPDGGGGSPTGVQATPMPVSVPHDPVLPDSVTGSEAGGSRLGAGDGSGSASDPSLALGPGLSGVTAPPLPTGLTSGLGLPTGISPGAGSLPGGLPAGIGLISGLGPGVGATGGLGLGVPGMIGGGSASNARRPVPIRRGLPAGAVLGEGGLGGGRGAGMSQMPLAGQPGRREKGVGNSDHFIGVEADEQWKTAEGVAPVIVPDQTVARHDPGPGILGFDR